MSQRTLSAVARQEAVHQHLTIRQTRHQHRFERLVLVGEVDLCTAPLLARALDETSTSNASGVLVDLLQVSFLALSGVQTLLAASARARAEGRRLVVVATSPTVRRVLSLIDTAGDLEVHVTAQSAQSALSR